MDPEQFVNTQMAGGAMPQAGMAPYPLYGVPHHMGEAEVTLPFYQRPWFCYGVGAAGGFAAAWAFFKYVQPRFLKKNEEPGTP